MMPLVVSQWLVLASRSATDQYLAQSLVDFSEPERMYQFRLAQAKNASPRSPR